MHEVGCCERVGKHLRVNVFESVCVDVKECLEAAGRLGVVEDFEMEHVEDAMSGRCY